MSDTPGAIPPGLANRYCSLPGWAIRDYPFNCNKGGTPRSWRVETASC